MRRLLVFSLLLSGCAALLHGCAAVDDPATVDDPPRESGRYYPVQLHLHGSLSEGSASMEAHDHLADHLDAADVLWWTDHDWRIARHGAPDRFDFESQEEHFEVPHRGMPWSRRPDFATVSWREEADRYLANRWARLQRKNSPAEGSSLEIGARARPRVRSWQNFGAVMTSTGGRLKISLAADVRVRLHVRPLTPTDPDAQIMATAVLSQHSDGPVALSYLLGGEGEPRVENDGALRRVVIPVDAPLGQWSEIELPITRDAIRFDLGGYDNSLRFLHLGVRVRRGATAGLDVDALRIEHEADGPTVLQRAEQIAAALQERSGIIHHIGLEISYSDHMNAYLPRAELPDFAAHPHGMTPHEIVEWVHARGGLVSYNHVFGTIPEHSAQYEQRVRRLLDHDGFGADLLEVGYPHRVFPLESHLEIWDKLSRRGVVIGGIGTSDSHNPGEGWYDGNNYVTWVYAESPALEDLLEGLRRRRAFFGDPMLFRGTLELRASDGSPTGSVVRTTRDEEVVELTITDLPKGAEVRWILQGAVARTFRPPPGTWRRTFRIATRLDAKRPRFVRAEIWLGDRGLAFSNCLYFAPAALDSP